MSTLAENVPFLAHARGEAIVLVRTRREVRAVGATCSHYGGPLADGLVAAGDVVRYPEMRLRTSVRIEHWVLAERHG